jgi:hypothetical protein
MIVLAESQTGLTIHNINWIWPTMSLTLTYIQSTCDNIFQLYKMYRFSWTSDYRNWIVVYHLMFLSRIFHSSVELCSAFWASMYFYPAIPAVTLNRELSTFTWNTVQFCCQSMTSNEYRTFLSWIPPKITSWDLNYQYMPMFKCFTIHGNVFSFYPLNVHVRMLQFKLVHNNDSVFNSCKWKWFKLVYNHDAVLTSCM